MNGSPGASWMTVGSFARLTASGRRRGISVPFTKSAQSVGLNVLSSPTSASH